MIYAYLRIQRYIYYYFGIHLCFTGAEESEVIYGTYNQRKRKFAFEQCNCLDLDPRKKSWSSDCSYNYLYISIS